MVNCFPEEDYRQKIRNALHNRNTYMITRFFSRFSKIFSGLNFSDSLKPASDSKGGNYKTIFKECLPMTKPGFKEKWTTFSRFVLIFLCISFLGWAMETVYVSLNNGRYCKRGFLHLPFCTIYGFTILAIYCFIGTPKEGGLFLRKLEGKKRILPYILLAMLIPSIAELITGIFFDKVFGIRLWQYFSYKFNLNGYICLEVSTAWGGLITMFMGFIFPHIKNGVARIPDTSANILASVMLVSVCSDWVISFLSIA